MPRLDSLNKTFNKALFILPVNKQSREKVLELIGHHRLPDALQSVVADPYLRFLFPHSMVPHVVWIRHGRVVGITHSEEVNGQNIQRLLQSGNLNVSQKTDVLNFDPDKPLLINGNGGKDTAFTYRSIFTGYKPGLPSIIGRRTKDNHQPWKVFATNAGIMDLYSLAYPQLTALPAERMLLHIPANRLQQPDVSGAALLQWSNQNLYGYELNLPPCAEPLLREMVRQDLNRYLGLNGRLEIRQGLVYFILEPASPSPKP